MMFSHNSQQTVVIALVLMGGIQAICDFLDPMMLFFTRAMLAMNSAFLYHQSGLGNF
jgi:hypothetical protein